MEPKPLMITIGTTSNGTEVKRDFSIINNMLVSGTTGSGKTEFIQSLIYGIMEQRTPDEARFVIFDSKGIDYMAMQNSPFLLMPVVNDYSKASRIAAILVEEAEKRIENMDFSYKPDIFFILDDYAQCGMLEDIFARLLTISRVAKIHPIIVTSTPTAETLSAEIKALIPYRLTFTTANNKVSQMVIGTAGAENLRYPGEFIYKCGSDIVRANAAYDPYIYNLIKAENSKYPVPAVEDDTDSSTLPAEPCDELTEDAIAFVLKARQASVSMLQRRFRIGYNRAARILDEIEEKGVIGPADGARPRQVLITENEYYGYSYNTDDDEIVISVEVSSEPSSLISNNITPDSFNSLPESVRRMIIEADKETE